MQSSCQIYVKGSIEAVVFYQKAFNLTIGMHAYNEDGTYEHASLMDGDNEIIAIAEDSLDLANDKIMGNKCPIMAFNVYDLGSRKAVDQVYAVLIEDARWTENPNGPNKPFWDDTGECYGFGLVDKFGVHWGVLN